ncbi:unnamed protein product [Trifolium pratense]|uniref:Uncharacterized protein n=1 Tax=Trifolium pratense TaxID=57577 RepID=A0ACB0MFD0_TRIPR|nr:unnamed protein product [Trifolium pratense]
MINLKWWSVLSMDESYRPRPSYPALLSGFVEKWHEETNNFCVPIREMTVALDNMSCLLNLSIEGRLLDSTPIAVLEDAEQEIFQTKGAHAFIVLTLEKHVP